ncbi:MAG: biopolymer transporter ExbD [Ignavibacteriaceae bacterium]|nr:biopolymer transporter ExbD [Ignavibacteriaceae bacterium]
MPKVKVARKSTNIDMTAMCDVAFLLLTFFMLTTKFKADEPVTVTTPKSISEIKLPDNDIMSITITKDGRVYYGVDGKFNREKLLQKISTKYNIPFTQEEAYAFSLTTAFGVPIPKLKSFLDLPPDQRKDIQQPGIPIDTSNNELGVWILNGRLANPNYRIAIRGDGDCPYPVIKKVIATLQSWHVNKFNLITNLEVRPKI